MFSLNKLTKLASRKNLSKLILKEINNVKKGRDKIKILNIGSGGEIANLIKNINGVDLFNVDIDSERKPDLVFDICNFELKKHLPSIKFFSIQNGARHLFNDIFGLEELKQQKNLKADFIFVFNEDIKKLYEKYIDAEVVVTGSFKNNIVPKFFKNKRDNLAYISQYRESIILKKQIFYWKKKKITSEDFYKNDKILLNNIFKFCKKNKIKFNIICATKDLSEKKYFQTLINNKNINFIEKKYNDLGVYKSIHLFSLIVCSWSTLGYECLSRDIKTCFFRQKIKNLSD